MSYNRSPGITPPTPGTVSKSLAKSSLPSGCENLFSGYSSIGKERQKCKNHISLPGIR